MLKKANGLRRFDKAGIAEIEAALKALSASGELKKAPSIERRRGLTPEEFERDYRARDVPVVIQGMVDDWPAVSDWSFDALARRCGDTRVMVDGYSSDRSREMSFAEFRRLLAQAPEQVPTPAYLQEWYYKDTAPALADDIPELEIAQYDFRRDLYGSNVSTNHQLWIGQRGAVTILHQDSYMVDVMHVQLVGEKRWLVMSPQAQLNRNDDGSLDVERLVRDPAAQLMEFVLRPGEVLFLPAMWWHRVELLSDSIGLGRKCLDVRHLQTHIRQRMTELLAIALNADEVSRTHPELYPVVLRRSRTWARRMNIDLSQLRP